MTAGATAPVASPTTAASNAFVAAHIEFARALGRSLADDVDDPSAFGAALRSGLESLGDPAYLAGQRLVAPGIGPLLGVRLPLLEAVYRSLTRELRGVRGARLVAVAEALARDPLRELRWFACWLLGRLLPDDPELAWQVLRRIAADADDWITVDTLATSIARGILLEPHRWAELEQLVYSPNRWERRLVGSTVATIPFVDRERGRTPEVVSRGLALVGLLIGDPEPDVQKALSWALRNLTVADAGPVAIFCRHEAAHAASTADGARAWVVRDALAKLSPVDAEEIRALLAGIRRTPRAPNTSAAASAVAAFHQAGRGVAASRPPLT